MVDDQVIARRMPPGPTAAMPGTPLVCDCGGFSYSLKGIVATGDLGGVGVGRTE